MKISAFFLGLMALFPVLAQAQFRPGEVQLQSISFAGSGCPEGTVRGVLAPDGSAITVLYDAFQARANASQGIPADRKNCHVVIAIRKPALMSFALESADFRGFVHTDPGTRARHSVRVTSGLGELAQLNVNLGTQSWTQPTSQNFVLSAVKPAQGLSYLACLPPNRKAKIEIRSDVLVESSSGEVLLSVDTADGRLAQRYNLKWIDCARVGGGILGGVLQGLNRNRF